ncbi:MAG: respiratory nitrate reductase subunit gamma [Anaerolineae bacterium]|nr:respiratory nitrate reductase subunit gamma [Anaerolineae bacterium]
MEHDLRLTIFWIVHLATLGLFIAGLAAIVAMWLKAKVPGLPASASRRRKLGAGIGFVVGFVFSRRIWLFLKALFVDGVAIRRLLHTDLRRWLIHLAVFGSWLILGIVSTITGVVVEFLPLFGMSPEEAASLPIIGQTFHADVWWVALLNDVLGLVVLIGMALILWRHYVKKDAQLRTSGTDTIILTLLTLIVVSGFFAEAFRLLADYTTEAGAFAPAVGMLPLDKFPDALHPVWGPQWGFIGYGLALAFGAIGASPGVWEVMHNLFFWLHFVIVLGVLYYLPFSRFFHVIMGPVIVAYNTAMDQAGHGGGGKKHGAPQPATAKGGQS